MRIRLFPQHTHVFLNRGWLAPGLLVYVHQEIIIILQLQQYHAAKKLSFLDHSPNNTKS